MATIILPVDFGKTTDKLLDGAIKFAKQVNGKICLIHVATIDLGYAVGDMGMQYFPEIEQMKLSKNYWKLTSWEQYIIAQGIDCKHLLKQGVAKDIILFMLNRKKQIIL